MGMLSPDLRRAARLLATGQILLVSPGQPVDSNEPVILLRDEPEPPAAYALTAATNDAKCFENPRAFSPDKEPWRRGRPLR